LKNIEKYSIEKGLALADALIEKYFLKVQKNTSQTFDCQA